MWPFNKKAQPKEEHPALYEKTVREVGPLCVCELCAKFNAGIPYADIHPYYECEVGHDCPVEAGMQWRSRGFRSRRDIAIHTFSTVSWWLPRRRTLPEPDLTDIFPLGRSGAQSHQATLNLMKSIEGEPANPPIARVDPNLIGEEWR